MPSTAAGRHFSRICQLGSDWPDTANPPRCSALTDECVTVLCERKSRGRDVEARREGGGGWSEAGVAAGSRAERGASQGPLSQGFAEIWGTG